MGHHLLSNLGWAIWIAIMLFAMVALEIDSFKRRKCKRIIAGQAPAISFLRWILNISNSPEEFGNGLEESLYCPVRCIAPPRELMDDIKELITFHRPCLRFPLSEHWWQLSNCDYAGGKLSAILKFPESMGKLPPVQVVTEMVWVFQKNAQGEIEIRLDWHSLTPWRTRHKHNILLSMIAYTEERVRRLNSSMELQGQGMPALSPGSTDKAGLSLNAEPSVRLLELTATGSALWPGPQDYHEAVQNPASCFVDEDLSSAETETNSLGMPRVVSGSFASVYRLCGQKRDWAVRCFLFPLKDQQLRYAILSRHLSNQSTGSMVEFSFVENGIKVGEKNFPILKMEWIDGLPLHIYVENHLRDRHKLEALRLSFAEMVCQLREARIAHGDLQHGNILVRQDKLFLVDYDGMFVPELARFHSAELGHPNYQHPRREGKHFGLFLDNFAGWLIDTSLLCLEEDPFLWDRFSGGDECLLFRRADLISPENSGIFAYLLEHSSERIKAATSHFLSLLRLELEEIPFLGLVGDFSTGARHKHTRSNEDLGPTEK